MAVRKYIRGSSLVKKISLLNEDFDNGGIFIKEQEDRKAYS